MKPASKSYRSRYIPTPVITDARQCAVLQPGQWVRFAWCDKPSRFDSYAPSHVRAFHFPQAASGFASFHRLSKAADAFAAFNRHARSLAR